jgi:hypothetical protein
MNTRHVTVGLLAVCFVVLVAWDLYVAFNGTRGDTISELVRDAGKAAPILPFALGLIVGTLAGHFFWALRE